ncbi:hypothetical protein GIB67_001404 [Kingdonia uniflora]|uniref:Uncharacterized protein n=1 Tax=Kingdonia uniflora TaxID=39325 RepID=A0A7J7N7H4_9MAGN|nr:hypothetical protein GIB67_001404 [Kingdonia uniflora]
MDPEGKKFGRGPREVTGAVDLINYYKLWIHHEFFCKRSLPSSVSESHYLHSIVGDTKIIKGEGMGFDKLFENTLYTRDGNVHIQPFDLNTLREAFQLRETTFVDIPSAEKGIPTVATNLRSVSKEKERKHLKHKDELKDKDKEYKKRKHHHEDRRQDKDEEKDENEHQDSGADHLKKRHRQV